MASYRDLNVFKESRRLAIAVHQLTLRLPSFEMFEEGSQVRRSSKAITALIVEGYGRRRYKADYVKYLTYALAECDETLIHLEFLSATKSIKDDAIYLALQKDYEILCKQLTLFIHWVEKNWHPRIVAKPIEKADN